MESPDRPLFPEILPVGLGLPMTLLPASAKPFPLELEPEEVQAAQPEEPTAMPFTPGD